MSYKQKYYYLFYHIKSRRIYGCEHTNGDIANLGSAPNCLVGKVVIKIQ